MPFLFSCFSHASFSTSTWSVSAWATLSMLGQSQSSKTSHSILFSLSSRGSKPCAIGFTISPGSVFTRRCRPSRWVISISKPQSASTKEMVLFHVQVRALALELGVLLLLDDEDDIP